MVGSGIMIGLDYQSMNSAGVLGILVLGICYGVIMFTMTSNLKIFMLVPILLDNEGCSRMTHPL